MENIDALLQHLEDEEAGIQSLIKREEQDV
jgi:hypothetical protein